MCKLSWRPLLGEYRQAKRPLDVKIEAPDLFDRAIEQGTAARFQGHDEGQGGVRISRLLQQSVIADFKSGEYRGHFVYDAVPFFHLESHVLLNNKIADHGLRFFG